MRPDDLIVLALGVLVALGVLAAASWLVPIGRSPEQRAELPAGACSALSRSVVAPGAWRTWRRACLAVWLIGAVAVAVVATAREPAARRRLPCPSRPCHCRAPASPAPGLLPAPHPACDGAR